jgi:hypothetical protein
VALALLGYLTVAAAQRSARVLPDEYGYRAKFEHIAKRGDSYDAVYIGSSLTYRSFQPAVIDPIVSRAGTAFRSFNLGMGGAFFQQNNADLDLVLNREGSRLRWIVLELPLLLDPKPREVPDINIRKILDHSPRAAMVAIGSLRWGETTQIADQARIAATDLGLLLRWHSSAGLGRNVLRGLFDIESNALQSERRSLGQSGGYQSLEAETDTMLPQKRRERFLRNLPGYEAGISTRPGPEPQPASIVRRTHAYHALVSQAERVRRAGLEVVWVALPTTRRNMLLDFIREHDEPFAVIDLSEPRLHPDLFAVGNRFDKEHLTFRGSEIFSRKFARAFLAHRAAQEQR